MVPQAQKLEPSGESEDHRGVTENERCQRRRPEMGHRMGQTQRRHCLHFWPPVFRQHLSLAALPGFRRTRALGSVRAKQEVVRQGRNKTCKEPAYNVNRSRPSCSLRFSDHSIQSLNRLSDDRRIAYYVQNLCFSLYPEFFRLFQAFFRVKFLLLPIL